MNEAVENKEQQQVSENDKITKKYDAGIRKLIALLKGPQNLKNVKISKDDASELVDSLLQERKKEFGESFKAKAKDIIDKKIALDKTIMEEERKFKNLIIEKKKEYNKAMDELFGSLNELQEIEKAYYTAVTGETKDEQSTK